ncbi:hypothetical protein D9619_012982 [Psilocybe cf. subviscida]|uniref:Alcohol dehydrogenase-like N-terminal domain-containing protein n=1 Tax=Psilocybe cf. subviscida TaxID=2480587 RepID=A0A8H5F4Y3_9AGAR|nr:hypothetical protein D9619_012982 [Psilocybe cf. subviscida]
MVTLPRTTKCIVVQQSKNTAASPSHFLYDSCLVERPLPAPKHHEVVVKIGAAGFNQKEIWIRRGLYPGIKVGAVYGTDGAGTVVASGMPNDTFIDKRVMLLPMRGWHSDPRAPETRFGTIGGGSFPPLGSFAEYVVVHRDQVIETSEHLDDVHAAA